MNRLRDYLGFAVRFVGLGYIALWPVSTPGRGDLFGAALLCHGRVGRALDLVCGWPHPLRLSLGLHATGALCAVLATLYLLAVAVRRARARLAKPAASAPAPVDVDPLTALAPRKPFIPLKARRRPMPPPRKFVPPRTHFGLRGLPQ